MNLSTILVKTSCTVGVEPRKRQICVLNAAIWNCSRIVLSYCLKREHCSLVTRTPVSRTSLPKFNSINIFSVTRFPDLCNGDAEKNSLYHTGLSWGFGGSIYVKYEYKKYVKYEYIKYIKFRHMLWQACACIPHSNKRDLFCVWAECLEPP